MFFHVCCERGELLLLFNLMMGDGDSNGMSAAQAETDVPIAILVYVCSVLVNR